MSRKAVDRSVKPLLHRGIWAVPARWFRVPEEPPAVPGGGRARSFRPAPAFLTYLRLSAWLRSVVVGVAAGVMALAGLAELPSGPGLAIAGTVLVVAALLIAADHLAVRLRFDTTWYVMTDRSLRIRRGIWTIREMTVTFENIQNVRVSQGPLQRWLGIADVVVETAAAGTPVGKQQEATASRAKVEGVSDAPEIRDRIAARMGASSGAGLGDEDTTGEKGRISTGWTPASVRLLEEIRDEVRRLPARRS